jgi:hypothetical protein
LPTLAQILDPSERRDDLLAPSRRLSTIWR